MLTPEKIKEVRKDLGMTLRELANQTPYHHTYIHQMETGFSPIPGDMITILKDVLKKKRSELKKVLDEF